MAPLTREEADRLGPSAMIDFMGRASRDKGKRGEREAAAFLSQLMGCDARRGVQYQGGPDSPDVVGVPGMHVEVKRTERLQLMPAIEQAQSDAPASSVPVVMWRKSRHPWILCLPADRLLDLVAALAKSLPAQHGDSNSGPDNSE